MQIGLCDKPFDILKDILVEDARDHPNGPSAWILREFGIEKGVQIMRVIDRIYEFTERGKKSFTIGEAKDVMRAYGITNGEDVRKIIDGAIVLL